MRVRAAAAMCALVAAWLPVAAASAVVAPGCTISGTPGSDVLLGTAGRDVLCGRGGDDRLIGGDGDDVLVGGPGDDQLGGGPGNDVALGGSGRDLLLGRAGDDLLRGMAGSDRVRGGVGDDRVQGQRGDDVVRGGRGRDRVTGGPGDDLLRGDSGADTLDSRDGPRFVDTVRCGGDPTDLVLTDPADIVSGCAVGPGNTAPVAVDDTYATAEDATLSLATSGAGGPAGNDTDADGDPLTVTAVEDPTGGTVSIVGSEIRFHPTPDLCGMAAAGFGYTVSDGVAVDTGQVTIDITCVDDDPVAVDDTATVVEDSAATAIDVLANDLDADTGPMTIGSVTQPANGTVLAGATGLTYRPNAGYCNSQAGGSPDTFAYTLTPGDDTATVAVTVTCVDDPPTALDDTATVVEDSAATAINVLANDTDPDGGPTTISSVIQPANGTAVVTGGGTGLTYQPDPNFCSATPDTFDYTLAPGASTATVSVTVTCVEDPPTAVDDTATVVQDSAATAINVLANDTDPDGGPITIGTVTQPANGTVVVTGGGTAITYQPDPGFCGTTPDTFTYTVNGGDSATVSVTVECFAPSISTDLSATPGAPAINQVFSYDAALVNTGNVPLDDVAMTFTVPVQMRITSARSGTYTGFAGDQAGVGVTVRYEKNTAPGVFTLWGASPNTTTNATLTAPPPGLGAGEYITRVRWEYGQAAPDASATANPTLTGQIINPDNAGNPVPTGTQIQATILVGGVYTAGPTVVNDNDVYNFNLG